MTVAKLILYGSKVNTSKNVHLIRGCQNFRVEVFFSTISFITRFQKGLLFFWNCKNSVLIKKDFGR